LHDYTNWIEIEIFWNQNKDKNILSSIYSKKNMFLKERGIERGAEALWRYKDEDEKMVLILFAMYVWQIEAKFPCEWSDEIRKLCMDLMDLLHKQVEELDMYLWNSRIKNIIPFSLVNSNGIGRFLIPSNIEDIIDIFFVNTNYILNKYILVKCTDPKFDERMRKLMESHPMSNFEL